MEKYTLDTDFSSLKGPQASKWMLEFGEMVRYAFADSDDRCRLLANLLIMERYLNTICQGLAAGGKKLSVAVQCARSLLWDYLEDRITAPDFQDFANDYYACLFAYNVGNIHTDAPKEFYSQYFAGTNPDSYELIAIEWSSVLLMELVAISGGQFYMDDFEECRQIDFYGVEEMLNLLESACIELTNMPLPSNTGKDLRKVLEQVYLTPLFRQMIGCIQSSLNTAFTATPGQYSFLRKEYQKYTILPKEYAAKLLEI